MLNCLIAVAAVWAIIACPAFAQAPPATGILQAAAVANGNGTPLLVAGERTAVLTVNCAACSGGTTVTFQGSQDGTNYQALLATSLGTITTATSTTTAGIGLWSVSISGLAWLRTPVSAYSAGTVTVTATAVP